MTPNLHFTRDELADRRVRACAAMAEEGLDGLLMFRQESMYYLTGYDTFGFVFFQCLYLGADGDMFLLTRAPDLRQAQHTSVIENIEIWVDRDGAEPARELRNLLTRRGLSGKQLGVEWQSYGLTAAYGRQLEAVLGGFVKLIDASYLVSRHRLVKSAAELVYVEKSAALTDAALDEAIRLAHAGADEGDILAAMQGAVFRGGGDYAGNEFIIGSGQDALLCRYKSGRRKLDPEDQLTLEYSGAYRHYHAAAMDTLIVGAPHADHIDMHAAAVEALRACEAALQPGRPLGEVFDAHARALDAAGLSEHRLNACGYSMGTAFAPVWADWPMIYADNPVEAAPGMVFFIHIIIANSETGRAQTLGRTSVVEAQGSRPINHENLDLVIG